jgi:hypothetical protein
MKRVVVRCAVAIVMSGALAPILVSVSSGTAEALPPPPPPVDAPGLPPFKIDKVTVRRPDFASKIPVPPDDGTCAHNIASVELWGPNVGLSSAISVTGSNVSIERRVPNNQNDTCLPPGCVSAWLRVKPGAAVGPQTIKLGAVDGRTATGTFEIGPTTLATNPKGVKAPVCDRGLPKPGGGENVRYKTSANASKKCATPDAKELTFVGHEVVADANLEQREFQVATPAPGAPGTTIELTVKFYAESPCWCRRGQPSCRPENGAFQGKPTWKLRKVDGQTHPVKTIPWQEGKSSVVLDAGVWAIDITDPTTPPGAYLVDGPAVTRTLPSAVTR